MEPNQIWTTNAGRHAMIVNNLASGDEEYLMLWYDPIDKTWNASPTMDRLRTLTGLTPEQFFNLPR